VELYKELAMLFAEVLEESFEVVSLADGIVKLFP
jgi:hypothetical protein